MIIALLNQKGGVGKTTLAVHLASALARRGGRVLLGDTWTPIGVGDAIFIEPDEVHQLQADADDLVRLLGAEAAGREADAARRLAVFSANLRALAGYTPYDFIDRILVGVVGEPGVK